MFQLRYYQSEAIDKALNYFSTKSKTKNKPLLILPTGAGKSIIIAEICKRLGQKVIIFQPTKELLLQNVEKFRSIGGECSIYSASAKQKEIGDITYATIGSVKDLGKTFKEYGVKYVIVDEAHLVGKKLKKKSKTPKDNADSDVTMYEKFLRDLGVSKMIGLTATPIRTHQHTPFVGEGYTVAKFMTKTTPRVFNDVLHVTQVSEMVENGYWKSFKYNYVPVNLDKLSLNTSGSDYTEKSFNEWFKSENLLNEIPDIVNICREKKHKKSILIFVPTVSVAETLASKIEGSTCIHGNLDDKIRVERLQGFANGKYHTIINCEILTTGYDNSEIDCIIMARPTQSLSLYIQMIGRIVRVSKENRTGLVVELTDNTDRFGEAQNMVVSFVEGYGWGMYSKYYDNKQREQYKLLTGVNLSTGGIVTKSNVKAQAKRAFEMKCQPSEYTITFGKYANQKFSDVPIDYLEWCAFNITNKALSKKINTYLMSLKENEDNNPTI